MIHILTILGFVLISFFIILSQTILKAKHDYNFIIFNTLFYISFIGVVISGIGMIFNFDIINFHLLFGVSMIVFIGSILSMITSVSFYE
ncbi:signal transduction histidine kinase [Alkalibacillus filiformis]|uniref:Signal transduction histidine kinase n=1 Tax=Alkalibacillus filiformis TaxID=200990 RepID=A0ABU0DQN2_9BACI|nr:signal transduction histidine kinase [Alkalibacillus filiformis]